MLESRKNDSAGRSIPKTYQTRRANASFGRTTSVARHGTTTWTLHSAHSEGHEKPSDPTRAPGENRPLPSRNGGPGSGRRRCSGSAKKQHPISRNPRTGSGRRPAATWATRDVSTREAHAGSLVVLGPRGGAGTNRSASLSLSSPMAPRSGHRFRAGRKLASFGARVGRAGWPGGMPTSAWACRSRVARTAGFYSSRNSTPLCRSRHVFS